MTAQATDRQPAPLPRTRAGVGKSNRRIAQRAGREAAQAAIEELEGLLPDLVLVFATSGYDQAELLAGIAEITGATPLCGCSGEGIITQGSADEGSHAVSVMAVASTAIRFKTFCVPGADADARGAARSLATQIRQSAAGDARLLLLFPDGLTVNCSDLLAVLDSELGLPIRIAGGASGSILDTAATWQYHGQQVLRGGVSALLIEGDVVAELAVSHGCEPMGLPLTITRAASPHVMEIEGRPAFEIFRDYLEGDREELLSADLLHLCMAIELDEEEVRKGDGARTARADRFIIRTPLAHDRTSGSLFFPGGIPEGARVRMSRRDNERIHASAIEAGGAVAARHAGQQPLLVLQFDCAGRGRTFGEHTLENTVEPLQRMLGKTVPWLGFHSFGEIAPLVSRTHYHNYSVVLCALYERTPGDPES